MAKGYIRGKKKKSPKKDKSDKKSDVGISGMQWENDKD